MAAIKPGPVRFLQRIAAAGALAPQQIAFLLPDGWSIEDHPDDSLPGAVGADGEVTGYSKLVPPTGTVITATVTTVDATPAPSLVPVPIATGQAARLTVGVHASVKSGAYSGGAYDLELRALVRNVGGTPVLDVNGVGPNNVGPGGTCVAFGCDDTLAGGAFAPIVGSTDATAGALYGGGGTLDGKTILLTVNGIISSALVLNGGTNAADQAALLAAIQVKWPDVSATIPTTHLQLVDLGEGSIIVGSGTANGALGLVPGTYYTTVDVLFTGAAGVMKVGIRGVDATTLRWTVSVAYQLLQE